MEESKLAELRKLVDEVMYASTKKEAEHSLKRLEFLASGVETASGPTSLESYVNQ